MELRRARPDDARGIEQVHRRAIMAVEEPRYDDEILESWAPKLTDDRIERLADDIEGDVLTFFVFESLDDEIVGFSCVEHDDGSIRAVYVAPSLSGRGLGSALLRQAEWAATQSGVDTLRVEASFNAVGFYESQGYRRETEATHELSDGTEMSCVRMVKEAERGMEATW
jgi:ribosomal protein S18 acetylase RimI-like enzyme